MDLCNHHLLQRINMNFVYQDILAPSLCIGTILHFLFGQESFDIGYDCIRGGKFGGQGVGY